MKLFSCDNCQQTLYFENSRCVHCGEALDYCPDLARLFTLRKPVEGVANTFEITLPDQVSDTGFAARYRQCRNSNAHDACNWLIAADESAEFCRSCALSEVIPDLSVASN